MIKLLAMLMAVGTTVQPVLAQAPAAAPAARVPQAPPAAATPQQREAALRQLGFSPAGVAAMQRGVDGDRALAQAAAPDIRAGRNALVAAAQATPFNSARFEQLLRDQQTRVDRLTAQLAASRVTLLRSLPPADQALFAKIMILGGPKPATAPPAAAAPPPRGK